MVTVAPISSLVPLITGVKSFTAPNASIVRIGAVTSISTSVVTVLTTPSSTVTSMVAVPSLSVIGTVPEKVPSGSTTVFMVTTSLPF